MTKKEDKRLEREAREAFFYLHPHEAYRSFPELFWKYFHKQCPNVTREKMEQLLKETNEEKETN